MERAPGTVEFGAVLQEIATVLGPDPDLEATGLASGHHIDEAVAVEVSDPEPDVGAHPVIVEEDWDIKTEAQAEQAMRQAVVELTDIRKEFDLPPVCAA